MGKSGKTANDYDSRNIRSSLRLVVWIMLWMATLTLADKAELYGWYSSDGMRILAIMATTLVGVGMIFDFIRFLKNMDEFQRRLQLSVLSLTLGVTAVGCVTYSLLVTTGFIVDEEVNDIFMLMAITYSSSTLFSTLRHR